MLTTGSGRHPGGDASGRDRGRRGPGDCGDSASGQTRLTATRVLPPCPSSAGKQRTDGWRCSAYSGDRRLQNQLFDHSALTLQFDGQNALVRNAHLVEPAAIASRSVASNTHHAFPSVRLKKLRYPLTFVSCWLASANWHICSCVNAPTGKAWLQKNLPHDRLLVLELRNADTQLWGDGQERFREGLDGPEEAAALDSHGLIQIIHRPVENRATAVSAVPAVPQPSQLQHG